MTMEPTLFNLLNSIDRAYLYGDEIQYKRLLKEKLELVGAAKLRRPVAGTYSALERKEAMQEIAKMLKLKAWQCLYCAEKALLPKLIENVQLDKDNVKAFAGRVIVMEKLFSALDEVYVKPVDVDAMLQAYRTLESKVFKVELPEPVISEPEEVVADVVYAPVVTTGVHMVEIHDVESPIAVVGCDGVITVKPNITAPLSTLSQRSVEELNLSSKKCWVWFKTVNLIDRRVADLYSQDSFSLVLDAYRPYDVGYCYLKFLQTDVIKGKLLSSYRPRYMDYDEYKRLNDEFKVTEFEPFVRVEFKDKHIHVTRVGEYGLGYLVDARRFWEQLPYFYENWGNCTWDDERKLIVKVIDTPKEIKPNPAPDKCVGKVLEGVMVDDTIKVLRNTHAETVALWEFKSGPLSGWFKASDVGSKEFGLLVDIMVEISINNSLPLVVTTRLQTALNHFLLIYKDSKMVPNELWSDVKKGYVKSLNQIMNHGTAKGQFVDAIAFNGLFYNFVVK